MNRSLIAIFSTVLMVTSFNVFSKDCSGEIAVPELTCMNPMGGADVRLYITEFQTCVNDKITELDRSVLGMNVVSEDSIDDIHTMDGDDVTVNYMATRTKIDAENRVDNLTFILPTDAKIVDKIAKTTIEMKITTKTEPDYEGADTNHYVGSFKILKANGAVKKKGKLICSINR